MNRRDLIETFRATGFSPAHRLGQNFLVDRNLAHKLVEMAAVDSGDTVVEVGPGFGMLTNVLLEKGACVYAVEKDERLREHLERMVDAYSGRFHVCFGDAVEYPFAGCEFLGECRIVANLPYAITGPWLFAVLSRAFPKVIALMLQREAADRLSATHGDKRYGPLSILLQAAYESSGMHRVPPSCFHPPPEVDSVLFVVTRKEQPHHFHPYFYRSLQEVFTQRRKQFMGLLTRGVHFQESVAWRDLLKKWGLDEKVRPEAMPLGLWIEADRCGLFRE